MKDEPVTSGRFSSFILHPSSFVAALGLFAMAAQALLFRDFFTVFDGNELGVGAFFGSWLIWIALGAVAGRFAARFNVALGLLAVAYALAFVLQQVLIAHARDLVGVQAFELFPFARMYAAAFAVNAPFSFLTGVLFTVASQSVARDTDLPAARVYIFETLGGCVGGVLTTVALSTGMPGEAVILYAAVPLLGMAAWTLHGTRRFAVFALSVATLFAALEGALPLRWAAWNARTEWARLLPVEAYRGTFATAQGRYLYGRRGGQFVVLNNGATCDSWPPDDHDAEVAAIHLAENPNLHSALVVGPDALGICERLHAIPGVEHVTWLHPDPAYARELRPVLRANGVGEILPEDAPALDLRAYADRAPRRYDAVILNLPDISTLAMNRYISVEGFQRLRKLLNPEGMVSIRMQGGENYLGTERTFLGASVLTTLESAFKHVVMKPGEETWLFASDADLLSVFPSTLRKQFEGIPGASAMYPPENIPALFPPDRIVFQQDAYEKAARELGADTLRITDRRPRALLFTLLLALKQAGWSAPASVLPIATRDAAPLLAAPLVIYLLLRAIYRRRGARVQGRGLDGYDAVFLAASTGATGMAANVLLMFQYQTRFGALYLHIGLIAALFMAGAFLGGRLVEWRLTRGGHWGAVFAVLIAIHGAFLLLLANEADASRAILAIMFLLAGATTGGYFPLAAAALQRMTRDIASVAARLQAADNLGGAIAAVIAPILLAPMLGGMGTALFLLGVLAINLVPYAIPARIETSPRRFTRTTGYVLAGCAIYALFVSAFVASRQSASEDTLFWDAARALTGQDSFTREQVKCTDGSTTDYAKTANDGYIFPAKPWATAVKGYAGPIHLAVHVDSDGKLVDYRVIKSKETRAYLTMVEMRKDRLKGKNLFNANPFQDVVLVSGASISDYAIRNVLERAGRGFAADALGKTRAAAPPREIPFRAIRDVGILSLMLASGYVLRYSPRRWLRRALLAVAAAGLGFALNLQYSMQHVLLLLDGSVRDLSLDGVLWLVAVLPIAAALLGNAYCGYVCPVGALQELVGEIWPRRWRVAPHARVWRWTRSLKYLLLFGLVLGFAYTRDYRVVQADPLLTFFAGNWDRSFGLFVGGMLIASLFMPRFWCRALCPAGAFLSLFNGVGLLARIAPPRHPSHCDLGVRSSRELDCLYCDRCAANRSDAKRVKSTIERRKADIVLTCAAALAFVFIALHGVQAVRAGNAVLAPVTAVGVKGTSRDVAMGALFERLDRGQLSKHPAEFQHPDVAE